MPQSINKRSASSRTRKSSKNGSDKKRSGCPGSPGKKETAPAVIANSIFALTLQDRPLVSVNKSMEKKNRFSHDEDYDLMYNDIRSCVQRAVYLRTGEITSFDPMKNGFDLSQSIQFMLSIFENQVIGKNWEYNIEKSNSEKTSRYHIVVYKNCDFDTFWHAFFIKNIVTVLKKENIKLHNVFLKTIALLIRISDVPSWWGYALGYADVWHMEDIIANMDFESEEEQLEYENLWEFEKHSYQYGTVKKYEQLIKSAKIKSVIELKKQLKSFPRRNPLVRWMLAACEFMEFTRFGVNDFIYPELCEEIEGLMFDLQMGVYWSMNDLMVKEQEEYLEAEANGCGIHCPTIQWRIFPNTIELPLEELDKARMWPRLLTELYHQFNEVEKSYERKNRKAA